MKAVALALLVAFPAWAQERVVLQVREATLTDPAGAVHFVQGGAYLDGPTLLATGKEMASLRAENAGLRAAPVVPPGSVVAAALICLAVGFAGGVALMVRFR